MLADDSQLNLPSIASTFSPVDAGQYFVSELGRGRWVIVGLIDLASGVVTVARADGQR